MCGVIREGRSSAASLHLNDGAFDFAIELIALELFIVSVNSLISGGGEISGSAAR